MSPPDRARGKDRGAQPAATRARARSPARRDWRWFGGVLTLAVVLGGGLLMRGDPPRGLAAPEPAAAAPHDEIRARFDAAVLMLHARQYEPAAAALHRVLELAPALPEAHVNMGYAMLGLQRPAVARDFFDGAIALQADQANAYYGLALTHEALGDLPMALGAMRSYLHLARSEKETHLRRARAALWEWEAQLQAHRDAAKR